MEKSGQRWALTKQGAATISQQDTILTLNYIPLPDSLPAFQMIETDQELLIASAQGKVILYDKTKKRFSSVPIGAPSEEITHIFSLDDAHFCTISSDYTIRVVDLKDWTVKGTRTMDGSTEKIWQDERKNVYAKLKSKNIIYSSAWPSHTPAKASGASCLYSPALSRCKRVSEHPVSCGGARTTCLSFLYSCPAGSANSCGSMNLFRMNQ